MSLLAIVLGLCAPLGCTLFPSLNSSQSTSTGKSILPPIQASPEAIQVDVFLLERPADDPLLRSGIWKEVDQIGALSSETRESLRENGFQLGIVSSNPPPTVQRLLGMSSEIPTDSPEYMKLMGNHHFLSPGREMEIATGTEFEKCEFQVQDGNRTKELEYDKARCVIRMKAYRLRDGWLRVDFQPEIHHGETMARPIAGESEWVLRGGQNIDVRHSQRFSIEMNVGERALVTSTSDDTATMGDRFFCRMDQGQKKQRVLVVQIVDSGKTP